ncbi:MAG TPA: GntR family transcriptional regulator, partial [Candidatus Methylomirabilis sp.]|nr:GntR family transcriptional regulator [Candidatus Methylomirabilis sp.]
MVKSAFNDSSLCPQPIRKAYKSISQILTEDIREGILTGKFQEGQYLRQPGLARKYGVSQGAIREALRTLEAEGLVESQPRQGARVLRLSVQEIRELWEMRILLEKHLVRHAVPALTDADLALAGRLIKAMETERNPVRWLALNRQFHNSLYRRSGRFRILRFAANHRGMMERYLRVRLGVLKLFGVATKEHRQILAACRSRNTSLAMRCIERHLQRTADSVVEFLESSHGDGHSVEE